jgi:hypothetical protein
MGEVRKDIKWVGQPRAALRAHKMSCNPWFIEEDNEVIAKSVFASCFPSASHPWIARRGE